MPTVKAEDETWPQWLWRHVNPRSSCFLGIRCRLRYLWWWLGSHKQRVAIVVIKVIVVILPFPVYIVLNNLGVL